MMIYLDMDGVFVDFNGHWEDIAEAELGDRNGFCEKLFQTAVEELRLFEQLKHYEECHGFKQFFDEIYKKHDDVEISMLSSAGFECPKHLSRVVSQKTNWLRKHNYTFPAIIVPNKKYKKNYCFGESSILIDDTTSNIKDWEEAGGTGLLYDPNNHTESQDIIIDFITSHLG